MFDSDGGRAEAIFHKKLAKIRRLCFNWYIYQLK